MKPADLIYREAAHPAPAPPIAHPLTPDLGRRPGRSSSRPATGLAISIGLHLALAGGFLLGGLKSPTMVAPPLAPMIVALERATPPSPRQDVAPGPQQIQRAPSQPQPPPPVRLRPTLPAADPVLVAPLRPFKPSDPGPASPETTAPPALLAPPAAQASNDVKITWEGQILARLENYRRFPAAARARRQQGVVHVRFRIDRPGRVRWARVERSSGFGELDRAALDTLRRAQPLPAIPAGRPDEIELVVPVEFFIAPRL